MRRRRRSVRRSRIMSRVHPSGDDQEYDKYDREHDKYDKYDKEYDKV